MKTIEFGKKSINVVKSSRSKYMRLRVTPVGEIKLTVPEYTRLRDINRFIDSHEQWLADTLKRLKVIPRLEIKTGTKLSLLGEEFVMIVSENHNADKVYIEREQKKIFIFSEDSSRGEIRTRLRKALIAEARAACAESVEFYAARLGVDYGRISIREQRSRWGSCSSQGNLNFNWKISLAPRQVFDYVVAHEVAHLKEHNHSQDFWDLVAGLHPTYQQDRNWLKGNSNLLEIL